MIEMPFTVVPWRGFLTVRFQSLRSAVHDGHIIDAHMLRGWSVLLRKGGLKPSFPARGQKCSRLLDAVVLYEVPVVVFEEDFHTRPLYRFHRPDLSDNAAPEQDLGPVTRDICTHVLRRSEERRV